MAKGMRDRVRNRRAWTGFGQEMRDLEDDYAAAKAAGESGPAFDALKHRMSDERRAYRELGQELGIRKMVGVMLPMWDAWFRIAVEHEASARTAYQSALKTGLLTGELEPSLVAVTAAAFSIEALKGDVEDLVAEPPKTARHTVGRIGHVLQEAFGVSGTQHEDIVDRLAVLFDQRNVGVHAYPEVRPTQPHPPGVNSGFENAYFNAVTAATAIDLAFTVIDTARNTTGAHRWVQRWIADRTSYFDDVMAHEASRAQTPRPQPVGSWTPPVSGAVPI